VKTQRIKIPAGSKAEIAIRKNADRCDGKSIHGYQDLMLIGPCRICIIIEKAKLRQVKNG